MEATSLTQTKRKPNYMKQRMSKADVVRHGEMIPAVLQVNGGCGSGKAVEVYLGNAYVWIDLSNQTFYVGRYAK
jgi:hypothetical protein